MILKTNILSSGIWNKPIKAYFFIFFIYIPIAFQAQILEINKPLFNDDPFFNTEFIRLNKVKSITGSRSTKKVQDIIRTKGLDYHYEFNTNGTLKQQMSTFHSNENGKDTSIISYQYNKHNCLTVKRKNDHFGFYSNNYQLDSSNNIVKKTYCRDENISSTKGDFKLGEQYVIVSDSFSYQTSSPTQTKKKFFNNYGKVYKEQTNYFNEFGYLIEEYSKFIIGNKKSKITYEYDEKGRVKAIDDFSDIANNKKLSQIYSYDEVGNVLEINFYKNEQHTTIKQYIYNKKSMLLDAQLIQDVETKLIRIIQYSYVFYKKN